MRSIKTNGTRNREIHFASTKKELYIKTMPERLLKGTIAFVLFIPLTAFSLGVYCFQANKWPWDQDL